MYVWIDIQTPKEIHYFGVLNKKLIEAGHDIMVTARDYDRNFELLQMHHIDYKPVGKHGGKTLLGKLSAGIDRQISLIEILRQQSLPDYCVSLASPEASRVAFGLDIKNIVSIDAPHATAVCRLTLPFATNVIAPACINPEVLREFGVKQDAIVQYDGVDEVSWIKDFRPDPRVPEYLGLKDKKYVLIRTEEAWAAYLLDHEILTESGSLIKSILDEAPDYQIVVLPRYPEQAIFLRDKFGENILIPNKAVDALSLMAYASLVMSGGGTMDREACLMGIPAISFFPLNMPEIETFLNEMGFPIWHRSNVEEASRQALRILNSSLSSQISKHDVKDKLSKLENPVDKIIELIL